MCYSHRVRARLRSVINEFKIKSILFLSAICLMFTIFNSNSAFASDFTPSLPKIWDQVGGILLQLLAIVIVIESALAALFQWRAYRVIFNARALKTPIMFLIGILVVMTSGYNPMELILAMVSQNTTEIGTIRAVLTTVLSALIIAGGSAGIFALLSRLGLRSSDDKSQSAGRSNLGPDQAWLSIKVTGGPAGESIQIGIDELDTPNTEKMFYFFDHASRGPFAGTIETKNIWKRIGAAFVADAQRFPTYGGRKMVAGKNYSITATFFEGEETTTVGIFRGRFASRAIIDLTIDLSKVKRHEL